MKLMVIVASDEYVDEISAILLKHNIMATEVGSTGDFLQYGDTVLLIGIDEINGDDIISILKKEGHRGPNIDTPYHNKVSIYITDTSNYLKVNAAVVKQEKKLA